MAFTIQTFGRISTTANEPFQTLTGGVIVGCSRMYAYDSGDTQATIAAADYFNPMITDLAVGDIIFAYSTTDNTQVPYFVSSVAGGNVTTSVFAAAGSVGTGNITNLAVTAAKIANNTITDTQVSVNGLTSASLSKSLIQYATGTLATADITGMNAAPVQLIAAPGAGNVIIVKNFYLESIYNSAAFTGGGSAGLQYGNTAAFAGSQVLANTIPATTFTQTSNRFVVIAGTTPSVVPSANANNAGIYISNNTAAFATGNGSASWGIEYVIYPIT